MVTNHTAHTRSPRDWMNTGEHRSPLYDNYTRLRESEVRQTQQGPLVPLVVSQLAGEVKLLRTLVVKRDFQRSNRLVGEILPKAEPEPRSKEL